MIITLNKRSLITISKELREKLGVEPGDALAANVERGRLILTPVSMVPRALKLTASGAKKESEADEDIRHGRIKRFENIEELKKDLNENRKNRQI